MNYEEKQRLLSFFKILIFIWLAFRAVKFVIGKILFFVYILPILKGFFSGYSEPVFLTKDILVLIIVWILLSAITGVLFVIYIIKINIPEEIFVDIQQNRLLMSRFLAIRITAIIGFFIGYIGIISMIMFLLLILRHKKELLKDDELVIDNNQI